MRLDDVFHNLGRMAGDFARQVGSNSSGGGVPLSEFDLPASSPTALALTGPGHVVVSHGESWSIEPDSAAGWRFSNAGDGLAIGAEAGAGTLRLTLPILRKITVGGSGRIDCARLARDAEISVAGSGRIEVAGLDGGDVSISIAGSGRVAADGRADSLALSIAGSGACDAEGLRVEEAAVNIAGSGDAIFSCDGEVAARLMGSGNVIVVGAARCSVSSVGSGSLTCERAPADA